MSKAHAFYAHKRMDPPRMILLYAYTVKYFTAHHIVVGMQAEVTRVVEEKRKGGIRCSPKNWTGSETVLACVSTRRLQYHLSLLCIPNCLARRESAIYRKDRRSLPLLDCEDKITYPSLDPSNRSIYRMPFSLSFFLSMTSDWEDPSWELNAPCSRVILTIDLISPTDSWNHALRSVAKSDSFSSY